MESVVKSGDASRILAKCKSESDRRLKQMREIAKEMFGEFPNYLIGVNGSVARRECTKGSDVDLFFLYNRGIKKSDALVKQDKYRSRLKNVGLVMPSPGGVFENPLKIDDLLKTIGGGKDTNEFITRRMLLLLEGEWVFNQRLFEGTRTRLIDVIRFWRTICVDFEHKTAAADKPRAIRLIKLRFSRMLLYLGGVAAVSQTKELEVEAKRQKLEDLFAMPTVERLQSIFGPKMERPLERYARFLQNLNDPEILAQLKLKGEMGMKTKPYRDLCGEAREFKEELFEMLMDEPGPKHDIVKALLL